MKLRRAPIVVQLLAVLFMAPPARAVDYVQCEAMLGAKAALTDEMEKAYRAGYRAEKPLEPCVHDGTDEGINYCVMRQWLPEAENSPRRKAGRAAAAPYVERIQVIDAHYKAAGCP